jgi:hypothetical protein
MTTITWPTVKDKEVTDAIRGAIGRDVTFWTIASTSGCSQAGCDLDPITNTSTNSFCPVCSGAYYIYTYSGSIINAHVTWGYSEQMGWVTGGQLDEGECRVQIEYTPANVIIVDSTKWVTVDNRTMQIVKKIYRGIQLINRILIDLIEKEY